MKKIDKAELIPTNRDAVRKHFAHLMPFDAVVVPMEHRSSKKNPHSLRCFRMIYQRDLEGNKLKELPRVRCKKKVVYGYLYCRHHGGRSNLPVPVDYDKKSTAQIYRQLYDAEMGDLLECFLNDPKLLDLKPDLASLRLIMNNYIKKLLEKPTVHGVRDFNIQAMNVLTSDEMSEEQKFNAMVKMVESINTITNGRCIDRINRCIEQIGKIVERIHKYETSENFLMTPEGMKLFLRAMIEVLDKNIGDDKIKKLIRQELLTISVETRGDVTKYSFRENPVIIDAKVVEQT